jgi:hypothetical protein
MAFVRKKRVREYEYYQLVENHWRDGQPRQKVLVHLGRYPTADAALEQWPGAIERLARFAQEWRQRAERLSKDPSSSKARAQAILETAQQAERRADALAANLKKLQDLKDQGVV